MLLGALVVIIPYLGFPSGWSKIGLAGIGLLIVAISYRLARGATNKKAVANFHSLPYKEHQSRVNAADSSPAFPKEELEITNDSLPLNDD